MASVSSAAADSRAALALEHEPLDVGRPGRGGSGSGSRRPPRTSSKPWPAVVVGGGQARRSSRSTVAAGQLQELGQQLGGRPGSVGHHQDGLDGPHRARRPACRRRAVSASIGVVDVSRRSRRSPARVARPRRVAARASAISMSPKVSAWSSSTRPCLNSSSTARKRTMTSSRSTRPSVRRRKRDAPDPRQLVDQLGDRVGHADADRGDVGEVDRRHRLGGRWPAGRRRQTSAAVTPSSRSGVRADEALLEARPARGTSGRPRRPGGRRTAATSLNVLHSSRRASSRSRSSQRASSSSRSTSSRPGQQPAGLQLDQRGGDEQELGGHVEVERLAAARARPGRRRRSAASDTS